MKKVFTEIPYIIQVRSPNRRYGVGGTMFITGKNIQKIREVVAANPELLNYIGRNSVKHQMVEDVRLASDNWPYLYMETNAIPSMYLLTMGALFILFS